MRTEQIYKINKDAFEGTGVEDFYIDHQNDLYIDIDEINDEFYEWANYNSEVIYYSSAMEFLSKHDPSLHESLELADDLGYKCKDLSSELLATLLQASVYENAYAEIDEEDRLIPMYHLLDYDKFDKDSDLYVFIDDCYMNDYLFADANEVIEGFDEWRDEQDEEEYSNDQLDQMREMLEKVIKENNNSILDND